MKRIIITVFLLAASAACADDPSPEYMALFGYGSIMVSGAGYPAIHKCSRTQFEYDVIKKVFYVKRGDDMTIDMRQILPKGSTMQKYLDSVVQVKGYNLKHRTRDVQVWSIWASHDRNGVRSDDAARPWPSRTADIPQWDSVAEFEWLQQARFGSDSTSGFRWDDLGASPARLQALKERLKALAPGNRLYVIFRIGYAYEVPAGQVEDRWDPRSRKWVRQISAGAPGYVLSDPISACTIELR